MSLPIQHTARLQSNDGQVLQITLEEKGWLEKYREHIDNAILMEFIPLERDLRLSFYHLVTAGVLFMSAVFLVQPVRASFSACTVLAGRPPKMAGM